MPLSNSKIIDMTGEKIYESKPHSHSDNPSRAEIIKCKRCQYEIRENELKDMIRTMSNTEKTRGYDHSITAERDFVISKIKVIRGKQDDIIGYEKTWQ